MNNKDHNPLFIELVLKVMNRRHGLALESDFKIENLKGESVVFDLADQSMSFFIEVITGASIAKRKMVVDKIARLTSVLVNARGIKSNAVNIIIIFEDEVDQEEKKFYTNKFKRTPRFNYEFLDKKNIIDLANSFGYSSPDFNKLSSSKPLTKSEKEDLLKASAVLSEEELEKARKSKESLRNDSNRVFFQTFNGGFWWLNAGEKYWPSDEMQIGANYGYYKYTGRDDRLRSYFGKLKIGDIAISYQMDPERRLFGIFQVSNITEKDVQFKFLHELPKKTSWNELMKLSWFKQTQIGTMQANGSLFPLTDVQFIALIELSSSVFDVAEAVHNQGLGFEGPFKRERRKILEGKNRAWWYRNDSPTGDLNKLKKGEIHVVGSSGNNGPRTIFENFFKVKVGERVFGFQGGEFNKVVCVFKVTQEIEDEYGGELVFEVDFVLRNHIEWGLIQQQESFQNSELARNPNADLVELTGRQVEGFLGLINLNQPIPDYSVSKNDDRYIPESKIANYSSDNPDGDDYLGIDKDVDAFAKVIAANRFTPPLAIGLFGKWGMGKSFFMSKLRKKIDYYSDHNDEDSDFCNGVAHIHFNAWSYMDANLWASFVTKIFEGLYEYISGHTKAGSERDEIERVLSEKLEVIKQERKVVEERKDLYEEEIKRLKQDRKDLQTVLNKELEEIKTQSLESILKPVKEKYNLKKEVKAALDGNEDIKKFKTEIDKLVPDKYKENPDLAIQQLKSVQTSIREFIRDKNSMGQLVIGVLITVVILVAPIIFPDVTDFVADKIVSIAQVGLSMIALATPLIAGYRKVYDKIQPILGELWKVKKEYDEQIENAKFSYQQKKDALEISIKNKSSELLIADDRIGELEAEIRELEFKLEYGLSTQTLYSFIEKRAASEEYKRYLGIISTIRNDFEVLSMLFTDANSELNDTDRFKEYSKNKLKRIVLYVDDLDRCPEERVVEVLEAVNLLMAFPLFVVVVGVDPRWVKNALLKKYRLQFGNDKEYEGAKPIEAANYLEKIFQVPFHLKSAEDQDVKDMLYQLNRDNIKISDEDIDEMLSGIEPPPVAAKKIFERPEPLSESKNVPMQQESSDRAVTEPEEQLQLSHEEVELMQDLSEVIGNNPRAIKRFVNVYQIVRAHEGLTVKTNGTRLSDFAQIMFLLALPLGPYRELTPYFYNIFESKDYSDRSFNSFVQSANSIMIYEKDKNERLNKMKNDLDMKLTNTKASLEIQAAKCASLQNHNKFIKRFTFSEMY